MMSGPFLFTKKEKSCEIRLWVLEEKMKNTPFTCSITKQKRKVCSNSHQCDSSSFLTATANTHVLDWCYFPICHHLCKTCMNYLKSCWKVTNLMSFRTWGSSRQIGMHMHYGVSIKYLQFFAWDWRNMIFYGCKTGQHTHHIYIQDVQKFGMYLHPMVVAMLTAQSDPQEMTTGSPTGKWTALLGQLGGDTKEVKTMLTETERAMPTTLERKQDIWSHTKNNKAKTPHKLPIQYGSPISSAWCGNPRCIEEDWYTTDHVWMLLILGWMWNPLAHSSMIWN